MPWRTGDRKGYSKIASRPAAQVVWERHHGVPFPKGQIARHTCDNPRCRNPLHIVPGTMADNIADKVARDRQAKGERVGGAKLTPRIVKAIRMKHKHYDRDCGAKSLAERYGVSVRAVTKIVKRESWKHI